MALKMTPYDIALAAQVIASFKTDVHRVTVAGVPEVFGQYYYSQGQSSSATRTRGQCRLHLNFFYRQMGLSLGVGALFITLTNGIWLSIVSALLRIEI